MDRQSEGLVTQITPTLALLTLLLLPPVENQYLSPAIFTLEF